MEWVTAVLRKLAPKSSGRAWVQALLKPHPRGPQRVAAMAVLLLAAWQHPRGLRGDVSALGRYAQDYAAAPAVVAALKQPGVLRAALPELRQRLGLDWTVAHVRDLAKRVRNMPTCRCLDCPTTGCGGCVPPGTFMPLQLK